MNPILHEKFVDIYTNYKHLVLFVCYKYLKDKEKSQDVTSDIFRELLEHPERLNNVKNIRNWLFTITKNKCFKELKGIQSEQSKVTEYFEYQTNSLWQDVEINFTIVKEQLHMQQHLIDVLHAALKKLKHNHRVCLTMYYLENKNYQEIMDATNYNFRQVDNFLYYGKQRLRKILGKEGWNGDEFNKIFNV